MYPILARIGPSFLYTFTVVMALGILAGLGLTSVLERQDQIRRPAWIDGVLAASLLAVAGGRAVYVAFNWDYFQDHIGEISLVWQGGLSYHGALLAGLAAYYLWARKKKLEFGTYAGLIAPALILVSAFGWIACWFEGCAYGQEAYFGPLTGDLPDSYGVYALRYQTQWMGFFLCLVTLLAVFIMRRRIAPIHLFWIALLGLSVGRVLVSFYRGDEAPFIGRFRLDTLADSLLAALALFALLTAALRRIVKPRT